MQRDMREIRRIVTEISRGEFTRSNDPKEAYHLRMLGDAKYIATHGNGDKRTLRLTWQGWEKFLFWTDDRLWDMVCAEARLKQNVPLSIQTYSWVQKRIMEANAKLVECRK